MRAGDVLAGERVALADVDQHRRVGVEPAPRGLGVDFLQLLGHGLSPVRCKCGSVSPPAAGAQYNS